MNVKNQRKIAAQLLKVGVRRVKVDSSKLAEIKEAITKTDIRGLISSGLIVKKPMKGHSRFHARTLKKQKSKGKRKGKGSRKGTKNARLSRKESWMSRVRAQRKFIKRLKEKSLLTNKAFRDLYLKIKSNRFRDVKLMKLYIGENNLIKKK